MGSGLKVKIIKNPRISDILRGEEVYEIDTENVDSFSGIIGEIYDKIVEITVSPSMNLTLFRGELVSIRTSVVNNNHYFIVLRPEDIEDPTILPTDGPQIYIIKQYRFEPEYEKPMYMFSPGYEELVARLIDGGEYYFDVIPVIFNGKEIEPLTIYNVDKCIDNISITSVYSNGLFIPTIEMMTDVGRLVFSAPTSVIRKGSTKFYKNITDILSTAVNEVITNTSTMNDIQKLGEIYRSLFRKTILVSGQTRVSNLAELLISFKHPALEMLSNVISETVEQIPESEKTRILLNIKKNPEIFATYSDELVLYKFLLSDPKYDSITSSVDVEMKYVAFFRSNDFVPELESNGKVDYVTSYLYGQNFKIIYLTSPVSEIIKHNPVLIYPLGSGEEALQFSNENLIFFFHNRIGLELPESISE